jgi:hypothetical protein
MYTGFTTKDKRNSYTSIVQSYLETLTSTLSAEMNDRKFKFEPESFSSKVSVKKYDTSTTNFDFQCKMTNKFMLVNLENIIVIYTIMTFKGTACCA